MVILKNIIISFVLFIICFSYSYAGVFYPEHYVLSNGIQIVIIKNKLSPAVGHAVFYKVGSAFEVKGKTGIAHYLEHMMFKGTKNLPVGMFHKIIASKGGEENAYTTYDYTTYHEVIAKNHLSMVMQMEADRMRNLIFDKFNATKEKQVVLSERAQRTENSPNGLFLEKLRKELFSNYPYGHIVIGSRKDVESLSIDDLKDFYKKYYVPKNAVVVVSGNVKTKDVLRIASGTYGSIPALPFDHNDHFSELQKPSKKEIIYKDERVLQPYSVRKIIVPSFKENKKLSLALEVLTEVLDGEVGILNRKFVMGSKDASSVSVHYNNMTRGASVFSISMSPASGKSIHIVENKIIKYLKNMHINKNQVKLAKQRLIDSAVFARDRLMAPVQILGGALAVGLPISSIENWQENISSVTQSQVNNALRYIVKTPYQIVGFLEHKKDMSK